MTRASPLQQLEDLPPKKGAGGDQDHWTTCDGVAVPGRGSSLPIQKKKRELSTMVSKQPVS